MGCQAPASSPCLPTSLALQGDEETAEAGREQLVKCLGRQDYKALVFSLPQPPAFIPPPPPPDLSVRPTVSSRKPKYPPSRPFWEHSQASPNPAWGGLSFASQQDAWSPCVTSISKRIHLTYCVAGWSVCPRPCLLKQGLKLRTPEFLCH